MRTKTSNKEVACYLKVVDERLQFDVNKTIDPSPRSVQSLLISYDIQVRYSAFSDFYSGTTHLCYYEDFFPNIFFLKLFINGEFVDASDGKQYVLINPVNEETICAISEGSKVYKNSI